MARPRSDSRQRLIRAARELLQRQGYQATGMSEIVAASGAPRGSIYFLFPGGKEELAVAAITEAAAEYTGLIAASVEESPDVGTFCGLMVEHLAGGLVETGYLNGCPVSTVTLDSVPASAALTEACRAAYRSWQEAVAEALVRYGTPPARATRLATVMLAAVEGAMILARAESSARPLQDVHEELISLVVAATRPEADTAH
ncbi:TetR/AcrR family transcriptional regulator [Actinomadura kijaniata]|uniref:TetR/AcrR family transcriptional regulator n=1 Tax=Actinomadura kijaniata TaxID=46161 RepID=UPI003F1BF732